MEKPWTVSKKQDTITLDRLEHYTSIAHKALAKAKPSNEEGFVCLDMAKRYIADAEHFAQKGDIVNAYGALNYAHGWLDCGARLNLLDVDGDSTLFTVEEKKSTSRLK